MFKPTRMITALLLSAAAMPGHAEQTHLSFGAEYLREDSGVTRNELSGSVIYQFGKFGLQFDTSLALRSNTPAYRWGLGSIAATYDVTEQVRVAAVIGADGRLDTPFYYLATGIGAEYRGEKLRFGGSYTVLNYNGVTPNFRQVVRLKIAYDFNEKFSLAVEHLTRTGTGYYRSYAGLTATYNVTDQLGLYAVYNKSTAGFPDSSVGFGLTYNFDGGDQMMTGRYESLRRICSTKC